MVRPGEGGGVLVNADHRDALIHGTHETAQVTSHTVILDNLRAAIGLESDRLMCAVLARDVTEPTRDAGVLVNLRDDLVP